MNNKICKCGHLENEHAALLDDKNTMVCFHPDSKGRYCECMEFQQDLEAHLKQVEANYDALQTPMPCGHLARYAVNGEEGTQYCSLCDREAIMKSLEVTADILTKTVTCIQLLREVDSRVVGLLFDYYDLHSVSLGVRINNAITELDKVNNP